MLTLLLDLLFPICCVECGAIGSYLCPPCLEQQHFYTQPLQVDLDHPAINTLYACCTHTAGARKLITTFKYKSAFALTQTITQLMIEHIPFPDDIDLLSPIPLHSARQRSRGYNQAERLTTQLSSWLGIPSLMLLQRTRNTTPQAKLNRDERLTHITDAFALGPGVQCQGKIIAVVDDVATTGTTLNEAAKVLLSHGARKVYGVVFAHGK